MGRGSSYIRLSLLVGLFSVPLDSPPTLASLAPTVIFTGDLISPLPICLSLLITTHLLCLISSELSQERINFGSPGALRLRCEWLTDLTLACQRNSHFNWRQLNSNMVPVSEILGSPERSLEDKREIFLRASRTCACGWLLTPLIQKVVLNTMCKDSWIKY